MPPAATSTACWHGYAKTPLTATLDISQIVEANRVDRILEIIERSGGDFNAVNISTAFHRLAKMWHDPQVWLRPKRLVASQSAAVTQLPGPSSPGFCEAQAGLSEPYRNHRVDAALQTLIDLAASHIRFAAAAQLQTQPNTDAMHI